MPTSSVFSVVLVNRRRKSDAADRRLVLSRRAVDISVCSFLSALSPCSTGLVLAMAAGTGSVGVSQFSLSCVCLGLSAYVGMYGPASLTTTTITTTTAAAAAVAAAAVAADDDDKSHRAAHLDASALSMGRQTAATVQPGAESPVWLRGHIYSISHSPHADIYCYLGVKDNEL